MSKDLLVTVPYSAQNNTGLVFYDNPHTGLRKLLQKYNACCEAPFLYSNGVKTPHDASI